jgi:mannitol-1-phosphate 5-dehydrogenase
MRRDRTYVGFGFGAIQAGLFLYEAFQSGAFRRLVVGEVVPEVVSSVLRSEGHFSVNVAQRDHVQRIDVGPVEIDNPAVGSDRQRLVDAVAEAEEIGTAVPSVHHYVSQHPGSLHHILAQGLRKKAALGGPRTVVYTAENHNHAAEILEEKVLQEVPATEREAVSAQVRFLNTVIGKMSGVVSDPQEILEENLVTITPAAQRAFLVEAFNRIYISKIHFDGENGNAAFIRGIRVFEEKEDLLPFEEAKLYGHNATHALAAYLGFVRGVKWIADLCEVPGILPFLRAAFLDESGKALVRKHQGIDPLFTDQGYREYAEDLLTRMTNPYLRDQVERVGRDPERKLAWDDRLIGTMRMAIRQGVQAHRYALGAAAALTAMNPPIPESVAPLEEWLDPIWKAASPEETEKQAILGLIEKGRHCLRRWKDSGFADLEELFRKDD